MVRSAPVDLDDLQGNILRAYRLPMAGTSSSASDAVTPAREWLKAVGAITPLPWTGGAGDDEPGLHVCRLVALGVDTYILGSFPPCSARAWRRRPASSATPGPAPDGWLPGLGRNQAHVLVSVYGRDESALGEAVAEVHAGVESTDGASVVHERETRELAGAREHFGFDDGFGQPAVSSVHDPTARGVRGLFGWWRSLPVGEFVLGYRDGEGSLPPAPPGAIGCNATYLVYREYEQDIAGFRRFVASAAAGIGEDEEWVAARIVGR